MKNLKLAEGDIVQIDSVNLQPATFAKFQPQSTDFLDIDDHKKVLENALRNFACLTKGDLVAINHNSKIYELSVLETKPDNAVSIIDVDVNVCYGVENIIFLVILLCFRIKKRIDIHRLILKHQLDTKSQCINRNQN